MFLSWLRLSPTRTEGREQGRGRATLVSPGRRAEPGTWSQRCRMDGSASVACVLNLFHLICLLRITFKSDEAVKFRGR